MNALEILYCLIDDLVLVWKVAPPETIGDLAVAISSSPSKNYFFVIFATCLALIFVGGLVFGRLSKRIRKEVKDRWILNNLDTLL